jgi:hypothetical protein
MGSAARCCPAGPWAGRAGTGTRPCSRPSGSGGGTHRDRLAQRHHRGHLVDRPGGAVRVAAAQLVRAGPDGLRGRPGEPRHRVQDRGGVPGQRATRPTGRPIQQAAPHVLALGQVDARRGPGRDRGAGRAGHRRVRGARHHHGRAALGSTSGNHQGSTGDPGPGRHPAAPAGPSPAPGRRQHRRNQHDFQPLKSQQSNTARCAVAPMRTATASPRLDRE